jgi:hypothetical protein
MSASSDHATSDKVEDQPAAKSSSGRPLITKRESGELFPVSKEIFTVLPDKQIGWTYDCPQVKRLRECIDDLYMEYGIELIENLPSSKGELIRIQPEMKRIEAITVKIHERFEKKDVANYAIRADGLEHIFLMIIRDAIAVHIDKDAAMYVRDNF